MVFVLRREVVDRRAVTTLAFLIAGVAVIGGSEKMT